MDVPTLAAFAEALSDAMQFYFFLPACREWVWTSVKETDAEGVRVSADQTTSLIYGQGLWQSSCETRAIILSPIEHTHAHLHTHLGIRPAHVVPASKAQLFPVEMSHPFTSPPTSFILFSKKLQHAFTLVQFNIRWSWGKKIKYFIELAVERVEISVLSHGSELNLDGEERVSFFPPFFKNTVKCSYCFYPDQPSPWNPLSLQWSHTFFFFFWRV